MKTILAFLFLMPTLSFAQTKTGSFTLNGTVAGLADGTAVKITNTNDNGEIAKGKVSNGKFTLSGSIAEPSLYYIVLGKQQPQHIFLENKVMSISGDVNKPKEL